MIYLDNAATSFPKPPMVVRAMAGTLQKLGGNPGRSGHALSLCGGRVIQRCRELLAEAFDAPAPENVIFFPSCTEALNTAIRGTLCEGDEVICSHAEHNAVMRVLKGLEEQGAIRVRTLAPNSLGLIAPEALAAAVTPRTALCVICHASNVTGVVQPVQQLSRALKPYGVPLLVDAAQRVYHMKQVRGRPFVRRTDVADSLQIGQIFVTEFADRKSLGFLVDSKKRFYTLGAEDYKLHEIPVGKFGPTRENMMIIGDMFYWTVTIQGAESKRYVAVNARDYSLADEYRPEEKPQAWAEYAKYLFPFELSFTSPLDGYVKPRIAEVSFQALWLGLALGAFYALIRRRSPGGRLWQTVGVVLFGLFLFVPLLVFGTAKR